MWGLNIYLIPLITTQLVATKFFLFADYGFTFTHIPTKKKKNTPHKMLHNNAYARVSSHYTYLYEYAQYVPYKSSGINVSTTHPIIQYHTHKDIPSTLYCTKLSKEK